LGLGGHRDFVRSNIVLMAASGMDNTAIAERLGVDRKTVSRWRKRFFEEWLGSIEERPRPGRPKRFSP
jgi:transposase